MGEFSNIADKPVSKESIRAEIALKKRKKVYQENGEQLTEEMEAALFAQCLALQKLKVPASAVFPEPDEMIVTGGDGRYQVFGYVDSQNVNGDMLREDFSFNVEKNGDRWLCFDKFEEPAVSKQGEFRVQTNQSSTGTALKFCKHCGSRIDVDCIICPKCGKQVEQLKTEQSQPQVIVNNNNTNTNTNINPNVNANVNTGWGGRGGRGCNKWTAFVLCLFLGVLGAHKFYEGKTGAGILYLFTGGLFGIGWFIDTIAILLKPNPYYV